jgi:hypothetical protein
MFQMSIRNPDTGFLRSRLRRGAVFSAGLLLVLALSSCSSEKVEESVEEEISADVLLGSWVRPDGGYILRIRTANPDGTLNAGYFNPRPINVGSAGWRRAGSILKVEVVLDDVNYQGSNYTLVYEPETDRLSGLYYQAVARQTFDVVFVRRTDTDGL